VTSETRTLYLDAMATEKQANQARKKHEEFLRSLGAHAIMVDLIRADEESFGVIALVDKAAKNAPKTLEVTSRGRVVEVPLVIKKAERFKAE